MKIIKKIAALGSVSALSLSMLSCFPMAAQAADGIVINEVCAKNTTFSASDGGFYDWIELYNTSSSAIDISGFGISDKAEKPYRFTFPEGTKIGGNQRVIVFCDSSLTSLDGQYAASFGLSTSGETIVLTDSAGNTVDSLSFGEIKSDISYGRISDGSDSFAYMMPTPESPNRNDFILDIDVEEPMFSKQSGFYDNDFSLTILIPYGTTVYYTLDGSEPTEQSSVYTSEIQVSDITSNPNVLSARTDIEPPSFWGSASAPREKVDKAFIVRAIAVDENGNKSDIVTGSYFIGYQNRRSYYKDMKVISLVTDSDNLFDNEKGIYVLGKVYEDWKKSPEYNPMAQSWTIPANYTQKGAEWERPASVEIFEGGELSFSQNVGIRIHGGATRSQAQKSFNIYARSDYGTSEIDFNLFDGNVRSEYTGKKIKKFDNFMIRDGGNDAGYTRFRDKLNQALVSDRNILTQGMTPCIVFINGEYWGHYEITEKLDDSFISAHYGVKKKDVCIVKNQQLDEGDAETFAEWEQLYNWIKSADLSKDSTYAELCEKVDIQSFIDYVSSEIYFNNYDWGENNMAMWKSTAIDENNPYSDEKWRFILFDTEYSTNLYGTTDPSTDSFRQLMEKSSFLADLLRAAMKNDSFREQFCTSFMDIANENFRDSKVNSMIDELSATYKDMVVDTFKRFGVGGFVSEEQKFRDEVSSVKSFYNSRFRSITNALRNNFSLSDNLAKITIKNDTSKGSVKINTISPEFSENSWSGEYYTDFPIKLSAKAENGYRFVYWLTSEGEKFEDAETEIPLKPGITITAVYEESDSIVGDVNADGHFNIADLVMMQDFLLGNGKLTDWQAGNVCKDNKIDVFDYCILRNMLLK